MGETEKNELDELTLEELRGKARLLADATGRDEDDILADLLDDGVLNSSNTFFKVFCYSIRYTNNGCSIDCKKCTITKFPISSKCGIFFS